MPCPHQYINISKDKKKSDTNRNSDKSEVIQVSHGIAIDMISPYQHMGMHTRQIDKLVVIMTAIVLNL